MRAFWGAMSVGVRGEVQYLSVGRNTRPRSVLAYVPRDFDPFRAWRVVGSAVAPALFACGYVLLATT